MFVTGSYFSRFSIEPTLVPPVPVSAEVRVTGVGNGLPVESRFTTGVPEISVRGGLSGSAEDTNSCTVPLTQTLLPRRMVLTVLGIKESAM